MPRGEVLAWWRYIYFWLNAGPRSVAMDAGGMRKRTPTFRRLTSGACNCKPLTDFAWPPKSTLQHASMPAGLRVFGQHGHVWLTCLRLIPAMPGNNKCLGGALRRARV